MKYYHSSEPFVTESGEVLSNLRLAYSTFGKLNENQDNVVWIVHALTANTNPLEWWPGVVGEDHAINVNDHFIVCVNCIGSHYGSTFPLDINPITNTPYYHDFAFITNRDIAASFMLIKNHLGIERIKLLVGASIGGQQAMEFAYLLKFDLENLILIATNAKHSPWGIAFNESQRMAIEADHTWRQNSEDAGMAGLKAARSIALLSYRTSSGYNSTQANSDIHSIQNFPASSYQRYQGEKLVQRFNAFSYYLLTQMMDSHNMGRYRSSVEDALGTISANTTIIGISSDILFPIAEQEYLYQHIPKAKLHIIDSVLGHDGFLTESEKIGSIVTKVLDGDRNILTRVVA